MSGGIIERISIILSEFGPRLVAGITFLPCGLLVGYTFSAFVLERNDLSFIRYGPFILGTACAFVTAMFLYLLKECKGKVVFWHYDILIVAAAFNLIGSIFFFIDKLDIVGAFLSYIAHGLTYITTLSYLHIISSKSTRSIFLSSCFVWYLLGISSAISIIAHSYTELRITNEDTSTHFDSNNIINTASALPSGIYVDFGGLNISCCIIVLVLLVGIKILDRFGSVEYKTCSDDEIRISNSNGTIFDSREEIIRRVQFFYVTKSTQWRVSFILLFTDAIYFSIFIYFMFWFSLNDAVRLTSTIAFGLMFWTILAGSYTGAMAMFFYSVKMTFLMASIVQILFTLIGIILFGTIGSLIPFWFNCFIFGATLACIKIALLETAHLKFTELLCFLSYATQIISISIIFLYFVTNSKNSYFYSTDQPTLVAHALAFLIILSLLAILVSLQIPRTYKTTLFDIRYELLGIVLTKHQIEQLNIRCLRDGTIPTISGNSNANP